MTFVRFGLIVTGRGEAAFLPDLFRVINSAANCNFAVIRRSDQLSPITSPRRLLSMVGRGQKIPTKDEEQFGLPALDFLRRYENAFILVIDDLEGARQAQAAEVFARYRRALDQVLAGVGLSDRAAVQFLVNMLEAYYFAHAEAVNRVAGRVILQDDHADDVEMIPHPKNRLKAVWAAFDEVEHGARIVRELDLNHVLGRKNQCCWLRSAFVWCIRRLDDCDAIWSPEIRESFQLSDGCRAELTANQ
jgi:hypothetical protein